MRPALLLILLLLFTSGCGKKGPLYLPDPPVTPRPAQPANP
jgi:predicted small lipoprotein YifL